MTQKNISHNPAKFLIFSIVGILYFFVPLAPTASGRSTWLVQSVNLIKAWLKPYLSYIVLIFVALLVIGCIVAKVTDRFPLLTRMYGSVKNYSIVLYILGLIFASMVVFQVGPAPILDAAVGGDGLAVSKTVIVTIIIAGLFVVFVTDFGLLELIGALIEPLMRPVFKVPGYASIDAVTSFVANPTLGIFLTNRLYKEKMYTTREAASIATNFSFISLGFFAVLVESAGILDHYGDVVLWSFILGLAEVALPSAFISGLGVAPAAAFFVVTVTALQIIMFSNSAVSIMESDIPLNAGKLVIIFFLRTLIAMPLVAIVTHIIF